jgi:hypothetical protein
MRASGPAASVLILCCLTGCASQTKMSPALAPGKLTVKVSHPTIFGFSDAFYEIVPAKGSVRRFLTRPKHWQAIEIHCFPGSRLTSPDGSLTAHCYQSSPGEPVHFWITDEEGTVYDWPLGSRFTRSWFWFPSSKAVALITESTKQGTGPYDKIWASAGHPVPHNDVYVNIVDVYGKQVTEYLVGRNIEYADAWFVNYSP